MKFFNSLFNIETKNNIKKSFNGALANGDADALKKQIRLAKINKIDLKSLLQVEVDGEEIYYPDFDKAVEKGQLDMVKALIELTESKDFIDVLQEINPFQIYQSPNAANILKFNNYHVFELAIKKGDLEIFNLLMNTARRNNVHPLKKSNTIIFADIINAQTKERFQNWIAMALNDQHQHMNIAIRIVNIALANQLISIDQALGIPGVRARVEQYRMTNPNCPYENALHAFLTDGKTERGHANGGAQGAFRSAAHPELPNDITQYISRFFSYRDSHNLASTCSNASKEARFKENEALQKVLSL